MIELERETDGRWIASVAELPGVLTYGQTRKSALAATRALARRVLRERTAKRAGRRLLIRFTACIDKEANGYVSRCEQVEVASQARTRPRALANLAEALELYFEDAPRHGPPLLTRKKR